MTFAQRVMGVLVLNAATFEDIEADRTANTQALVVVLTASLAAGLGAGARLGPLGLVRETFGALVGWVMWAAVSWVIGAKLLPERQTRTDMGELLRVIGYAYAPTFFGVLAFLPVAGALVFPVVGLWLFATMTVAVRQALDYTSTVRAVAVVLIGWLIFAVIQWIAQAYTPAGAA